MKVSAEIGVRCSRRKSLPLLLGSELLEQRCLLTDGLANLGQTEIPAEFDGGVDDNHVILGEPPDAYTPTLKLVIPDGIRVGQTGVKIEATDPRATPQEFVDCWVDWNGDGIWSGAAEQLPRETFTDGQATLSMDVPAWAQSGTVQMRMRTGDAQQFGYAQFQPVSILPPLSPGGQFGPEIPIDSTTAVQFTSTADLDRDGDLDILSASFDGSGMIAWYENDGHQNFNRHILTTDATDATSVIPVDINGDGNLDLLVSSLGTNSITWYENDSQQQFTPHNISTTAWAVSSLFAADIDQDGDQDFVASTKGDNSISWYENLGNGEFTRHLVTNAVYAPCAVWVADMNGDRLPDIVSASFSDNKIACYANNGQQVFLPQIVTKSAAGIRGLFVADLDGDGDQDLVASCLNGDSIDWFENDGFGRFQQRVIDSSALQAAAVYAADLDGDGDMDILGASRSDTTISWYENVSYDNFVKHVIDQTISQSRGIVAADINGDGLLDILSASKDQDTLRWYANKLVPVQLNGNLNSASPEVLTAPVMPVTLTLNLPLTAFSLANLSIENGIAADLQSHGRTYTFTVTAQHEGPVTITLPSGVISDGNDHWNQLLTLTRQYTKTAPELRAQSSPITFVSGSAAVAVVVQPEVGGSRLAGGKLTIVLQSSTHNRIRFDRLDDKGLDALGVVTRSTLTGKIVVTVLMSAIITAQDIQAALESLTFSTSKAGLLLKSRQLQVKLTDNSGHSSATIVSTINVIPKAVRRETDGR